MNNVKTISIMVAALFVCLGVASIGGAEYIMEGKIEGKVTGISGIVSPHVNLTNQTVSVKVDVTTNENTTTYFVNDTLKIDVNFTDETGREIFLFPRTVYYSVLITRSFTDAKLKKDEPWEDGFIKRLFPAKEFGAIKVVDSLLDNKDTNLTIDLDYSVSNATYHVGHENLTMHVFAMGFLPGEVNGLGDEGVVRGVEHKIVELNVEFI